MDGVRRADRRHVPGLMRSVEEHQRVVADLITARARPVALPLADAEGLVLAADVIAPLSLPVFDNSAMDGYAVLAADVAGATGRESGAPAGRRGHPGRPHRSADTGTRHRPPHHDRRAAARPGPPLWCRSKRTDGGTETVEIRAAAAKASTPPRR